MSIEGAFRELHKWHQRARGLDAKAIYTFKRGPNGWTCTLTSTPRPVTAHSGTKKEAKRLVAMAAVAELKGVSWGALEKSGPRLTKRNCPDQGESSSAPLKTRKMVFPGFPGPLSADTVSEILAFLPVRSVTRLGVASRECRTAATEDRTWRRLYARHFSEVAAAHVPVDTSAIDATKLLAGKKCAICPKRLLGSPQGRYVQPHSCGCCGETMCAGCACQCVCTVCLKRAKEVDGANCCGWCENWVHSECEETVFCESCGKHICEDCREDTVWACSIAPTAGARAAKNACSMTKDTAEIARPNSMMIISAAARTSQCGGGDAYN